MIKVDSKDAEKLLRKRLNPFNIPTDYIASYRTASGRELALERDRTEGFFVWLQKYTTEIGGITIENIEHPVEPYLANQNSEVLHICMCSNLERLIKSQITEVCQLAHPQNIYCSNLKPSFSLLTT